MISQTGQTQEDMSALSGIWPAGKAKIFYMHLQSGCTEANRSPAFSQFNIRNQSSIYAARRL